MDFWGQFVFCNAVMEKMKGTNRKCTENSFSLFAAEKYVRVEELGVLDITLLTKVHLVKAMVFPVVMKGCELDCEEG